MLELISLLATSPLEGGTIPARPASDSYQRLVPLAPGGPWLGYGSPASAGDQRPIYLVIDRGTLGRAEFRLLDATAITGNHDLGCELEPGPASDATAYYVGLSAQQSQAEHTLRVDYLVTCDGSSPSEVYVSSGFGGSPDAGLPTEAPRLSVCRVRE